MLRAVGANVTKFKVGDIGGVGCMVASCGECENCLADREQNCLNGTTFAYDAPDKVGGGRTYGGYSDAIVVTEKFVIRIPPGVDLAAYAPILCAGVTTFSPATLPESSNKSPEIRWCCFGPRGQCAMARASYLVSARAMAPVTAAWPDFTPPRGRILHRR